MSMMPVNYYRLGVFRLGLNKIRFQDMSSIEIVVNPVDNYCEIFESGIEVIKHFAMHLLLYSSRIAFF